MAEKIVKYMEIFEYYKNLIIDGKIAEGERLPTEFEIGEKFSVSRHTVRQSIGELEKEGYIYREKSVGAFVKKIDSCKKINKMVIVITTYLSDYIFPYLIKGIEERLSKEGYDILLLSTNNDKEKEKIQLQKLLDYDVVGAIIEPTASALGNTNIDYYKEIMKKGIPYLMINEAYDKEKESFICMNDEKCGYELCNYLINLGHKKIAGIFKEDDIQGLDRKNGYLRALKENGIEVDRSITGTFKTFEEDFYVQGFAKSLLTRPNRPTAIVCYNDKTAMNVVKATREIGVKIPDDVSIVGCDHDRTISTALECGLTTIRHPKERMGIKAAEMLISLIEKKKNIAQYIYEPEFICKNSAKRYDD